MLVVSCKQLNALVTREKKKSTFNHQRNAEAWNALEYRLAQDEL